jgi:hypothetical protein
MTKWRRFEVLLPLRFNDGRMVPRSWLGQAMSEVADRFNAGSFETSIIEGYWRHRGVVYRDQLIRFFVDVLDTPGNRTWMRNYKARWENRLQQLELRMVSYRIEVE